MDSHAVKTLDRLVEVLDSFTTEQPAWSLAELSAHLHTPRSTLHRFLAGLESHGLLRRDADERRWRLGYHLVAWGSNAAESTTLRNLARPVIARLMETSGETSILSVYQGRQVIFLDMCETSQALQLRMVVGTHRPPHAGASSKVLMAYLPQAEIETIIKEGGLPRLCSNTITDRDALGADLERIVQQGYAVSLEETDPGSWGVATPVFDQRGRVVAAVGLAGPTMRYSDDKVQQWADLCRQASLTLGHLIANGGRHAKRAAQESPAEAS